MPESKKPSRSFTMFHHVSPCFTMFHHGFTMFHHVSPCFTMFHHVSPCFTMFHHVSPCFTMFHHVSPCFTMFHHVSPCFTMFHHVSPCFTMFHHVSPCFTMFHHLYKVWSSSKSKTSKTRNSKFRKASPDLELLRKKRWWSYTEIWNRPQPLQSCNLLCPGSVAHGCEQFFQVLPFVIMRNHRHTTKT